LGKNKIIGLTIINHQFICIRPYGSISQEKKQGNDRIKNIKKKKQENKNKN